MATWTSLGTATLYDGANQNLGSVKFEYDSASASGTTWPARLRIVARSGYSFTVNFNNITVGGTNYGSKSSLNQNSGTFWTGNLSAGSKTATWTCPWYNGSKSYSITGTLPTKGSAPSGGYVNNIVPTWNSVTATFGVNSDGGATLTAIQLKVLKEAYVAGVPSRQYNSSSSSIGPYTVTVNNDSPTTSTVPTWSFVGCGFYHTGVYANNAVGPLRYQGPTFYTPPAPVVFNYARVGETAQWQVTLTGDPNKNDSSYTAAQLTRSMRYKIDNGSWVNVESSEVKAIDATTIVNITVPYGSTATIEGWMTYQGQNSEVSTITITNGDAPVHLYGSINGESQLIRHLYGSVNGRSKKIVKLYASVGGVAKLIHVDTGE